MTGYVDVVVGGQFGSEGKGNVVAKLAAGYDVCVRTGGPNAGHTVVHEGMTFKMQSVPCGWVNPNTELFIGAGAVVDLVNLKKEVDVLDSLGYAVRQRIRIANSAGLLERRHHAEEGGTSGKLHASIGSTGEGVGAARLARISRDTTKFRLASAAAHEYGFGANLVRNEWCAEAVMRHARVMLEGTQGFGLSLVHGTWPFVTSHDATAGTLAADAGVPIGKVRRVYMVVRTFPIRVAGQSGPLINETTWSVVSDSAQRQLVERTTVTNKIRRVAAFDADLVRRAYLTNGPTDVVLNFADYIDASVTGKTAWNDVIKSNPVAAFVSTVNSACGYDVVTALGTGGPSTAIAWKDGAND